MKRYVKCNSIPEGINRETPEAAFKPVSDQYADIDEFCEEFYDMPADEIKYIYSVHDGTNEDECIETVDADFIMCYSGYGFEPTTKDKMIEYFTYMRF